ncbi:hypothetical protein HDV62DRAFT_389522 [Trichoderma sp. SZMC 28011]
MANSQNICDNRVGDNGTFVQGNENRINVNIGTSNPDISFLQDLSKTDPAYDKKRILKTKEPLLKESFSWILEHEDFKKWRHKKDSGVLWIKGDPGKGKTMLLCGIIEDLEKKRQSENHQSENHQSENHQSENHQSENHQSENHQSENHQSENHQSENLSYFFCQATEDRINTAAAVVGGLVRTLLQGHPVLLSLLREKHKDGPKGQLDGANALFILCDIFETITSNPDIKNVICVVDALDECIKDCNHLLNLIIKTSCRVKWLLSSRNEEGIEKMLDQVPRRLVLELKQNAEQISISIDAYIRNHIQQIGFLKKDKRLQKKTLDTLKNKAQGTFLWVALVIEQLRKAARWEVEIILKEMPEGLGNLYGLILDRWERLGERRQKVCKVLLSIVTTAKRPLHLQELLVFINSYWKDSEHFGTTYDLQDAQDMTKLCGSILCIRENTVYFIHQSAKDYVVKNADRRIFPIPHQHYKLFEASLDAMSNVLEYNIYGLEDPGIHIDHVSLKDVDSDPLASIRYCCVFWIEHLVSSYKFEKFEYSKYFKDDARLHSFFEEKFLCWIESLSLMRSCYPQAQDALQKLKGLVESYCGCGNNESKISQTTQLHRKSETQSLRQFIDDAYRFVGNCKESLASWPLQLYYSAMNFEQESSIIRKLFEQTIRQKFSPSPILTSGRHNQPSIRLQSSFHAQEGPLHYSLQSRYPTPLAFSPNSSLIGQMIINETTEILGFRRPDSGILECAFRMRSSDKFAFFPISDEVISVSEDGHIRRWSMDKKCCIKEQSLNFVRWHWTFIEGVHSTEETIGLSPKGDLVASWHRKKKSDRLGLIRIWNTETTSCDSSFESDEPLLLHATFSPNSQLLAVSFNDGIGVHRAKTGEKVKYLNSRVGNQETSEARENIKTEGSEYVWFSPNSKILITIVPEDQIYLWDTDTWQLLHNIADSPRVTSVGCLAISPDSVILATSSRDETKLWSTETGECVGKIPIYSQLISFAPNWTKSSLIAIQQQGGLIQTWFIDISQTVDELQHNDYVFEDVIISPDSKLVVSRHRYRSDVYVWSGDDGQLIRVLKWELPENKSLFGPMIFSPDSQLLAHSGSRGNFYGIQIWRVTTGEPVCLLRGQGGGLGFTSATFSSDAKRLIAGDYHGAIYIWRMDSGQLVSQYDLDYNLDDDGRRKFLAIAASISPESAYAAALWDSWQFHGRIWHLHTSKTVVIRHTTETWIGEPHLTMEAKVSFSSDSAILIYADRVWVRILDVNTGACLQSFAHDSDLDLRLLSFDSINDRILTFKYIFYKTFSWERWRMSPRLGYSYDYCFDNPSLKWGTWILLDGNRNCYVPSNFRPGLSRWPASKYNLAMTGSLLAILNELGEIVIIKLPTQPEVRQQAIETFDVTPNRGDIVDGNGNPHLIARVPLTSDSGLRNHKRKRGTSSASGVSSIGSHYYD